MDLVRAVLNAEQLQLRLTTQRIANYVDVSMENIMGFGGNNGRRHDNNGGRACCIVDQMGIKSGQCHTD